MKELIIVSTEVNEENEDRYSKIIKFTFDGFKCTYIVSNYCGIRTFNVLYGLKYAVWTEAIGWWNTDTIFNKEKDKEFLEAFRNKFGIKIPAV